jgi:hypothetical protein
MPDPEQFPSGRLAGFLEDRDDAQTLPKFTQAAQYGCFGQFPPQDFPRLGGSQRPVLAVFV